MTHAELLKATAEIAVRFGQSSSHIAVAVTAAGVPVRWINYALHVGDHCVSSESAEDALNRMATRLAGTVLAASDNAERLAELLGDVAKEAA
jgi:hypothetical protein